MEGIAADQAESAQDKLNDIKEARQWVEKAKAYKQKCKDGDGDAGKDGDAATMDADMKAYFQKHGVEWETGGDDDIHNADGWQVNIDNLQTYENDLSDTQDLKMLKVKSAANKYSESVQASNKFLGDLSQLINSLINK